jgi:uncharacterized membrane protein
MAGPLVRLRGPVICATLDMLALSVWTGGLVVIIAAVIPAVFNSLGMEPGGRFLTRTFDGYNRLVLVAMAVMGGTIAARLWWGQSDGWPEAVPGRVETLLFGTMALITVLIIAVLGPQSVALQEAVFATGGDTARKAAYDAFFRVHMVVRGLYLVNLVLGIALMAVKLRFWLRKDS